MGKAKKEYIAPKGRVLLGTYFEHKWREVLSAKLAESLVRDELNNGRLRYHYLDRLGVVHQDDQDNLPSEFWLHATIDWETSSARHPERRAHWGIGGIFPKPVLPPRDQIIPALDIFRIQVLLPGKGPQQPSTAQAEAGCYKHLFNLAKADQAEPSPKRRRRKDLLVECKAKFKGLSGRAFERARKRVIEKTGVNWDRPGASKKSPH